MLKYVLVHMKLHIYLIDMIKTNLNSGEKSKTGEKASAEIDTEIDAERAFECSICFYEKWKDDDSSNVVRYRAVFFCCGIATSCVTCALHCYNTKKNCPWCNRLMNQAPRKIFLFKKVISLKI